MVKAAEEIKKALAENLESLSLNPFHYEVSGRTRR